jgi:type IV secretion system protein VirD4
MIRELLIAPRIGLQVAATSILAYGAWHFYPPSGSAWFSYIVASLLTSGGFWLGIPALLQVIKYHAQVRRKRLAKQAQQGSGDASFETEAGLEAAGCFDPNGGVPVGLINGRPIFARFTHALVNAPAGTQKTVAAVIPALAHGYRIPGKRKGESTCASAVILDLKRELREMTARVRKEVHGQRVIFLDPADPATGAYNPLDLIVDCLHGSLPRARALTFANLIALILEPEPGDDAKNKFFREGPRNIVVLVILWLCHFHRERAVLTEVSRIIRDPLELERVLTECANSDAFNGELGVTARNALEQGKYLTDFRTGASLVLKVFSAAGELATVMGTSTFRWSQCKRESMAIYICANLAESRVFAPWLKLIAECCTLELEFSQGNVPVHLCLDEATNVAFDISPKLTALRSAGVRAHIIVQERSEVERVFGKQAMHTIYGEVDCEQYFGIQDHHLAKDLEARLGTVEIVKPSYQTGENPWDAYTQVSNSHRKPLMTAYELMHCMKPQDQIVFIRSRKHVLRPIYCQKLTYDTVREWLTMLDDNPIEGGKLPGPSRIRMAYGKKGVRVLSFRRIGRLASLKRLAKRARFLLPPLWAAWAGIWLTAAYAAFTNVASFFNS